MHTAVPEAMRPFRKLLRSVAELHVRGYQRIRIVPYLYDLGTWRCVIVPACYVSGEHGARWVEGLPDDMRAPYTSAGGREYWGWRDDHHCSPSELAGVFLEHMLHVTYPDAVPISWSDQQGSPDYGGLLGLLTGDGSRERERIPAPPVGYGIVDHRG